MAWCPGLLLEDKTFAITCHTRMVPPQLVKRALEEFQSIAQPQIDATRAEDADGRRHARAAAGRGLAQGTGHRVDPVESPPAARRGRCAILYLGDDRTDEDAFAALGKGDIAVGVGDRPHANLLDWRLAGPASVGRLFGFLARFRAEDGGQA